MNETRLSKLKHWLSAHFQPANIQLTPLAGDASFRRYYRATVNENAYVVMDAPPQEETVTPFIEIANTLRAHHILTPEILASDIAQGFLLLSDFGDQLLLPALNHSTVSNYYAMACQHLLKLQRISGANLPRFDADFMAEECNRFTQWYCHALLQCDLNLAESACLKQTYQDLIAHIKSQPQVMVHRDFHSRNLMIVGDGLGVLDFQDAVLGPVTYDIASLFRDCYIDWPQADVKQWALAYRDKAVEVGIIAPVDDDTFIRWLDMTSLQRHIKCVGIFARLALRDQKRDYLKDIPRVLNYIEQIAVNYPEFSDFLNLIQTRAKLPEALIA